MRNDGTRRVVRIVIFPRYTALIGGPATYSGPLDMRPFSEGVLTGWQGTGLGTTPATVEFTVQQSADLEFWHDGTPFSPASANSEVTATPVVGLPWMRVKADVAGADPGVSVYLVGDFVLREGVGEGVPE